MIYLDYAATSGRKPEAVYDAVNDALRGASGNPGRSGHSVSLAAGQIVEETRLACSRLFGAEDPDCIAFTSNCTEALNLAIRGAVQPGDHVITSVLEHNSVARPLEHLKETGLSVTKIDADLEQGVDPEAVRAAITSQTRLVVMTHVSNVTGTINDIEAIGRVCRAAGVIFCVDAAQSAGALEIDVQRMGIDLLAFPGHKCLYGPQGTGGLYIRRGLTLAPLVTGGTGTQSELLRQPEEPPARYESGTVNVPGIAGLGAGIRFLLEEGLDRIHARDMALTRQLLQGIRDLPGLRVYGPAGEDRGPVVSITIEGYDPQEIAIYLDQIYGIGVRSGLHCAPYAHQALGTLDGGGTVRISPGYFTSEAEIDACIAAIGSICRGEV